MANQVPLGFRLSGVHCGIKADSAKEDLTLIVTESPVVAAGVYTQNVVVAPSVVRNREITPTAKCCGVVVNSGNANACTGQRGRADNQTIAELAASACNIQPDEILVLSTGVIGTCLPMEQISSGIQQAAKRVECDNDALFAAARGMVTTDKSHKLSHRVLTLSGQEIRVTGIAKGAGMIGPNMATMLAVLMTDAALTPADAQAALTSAVDESFNCTSVDGHTSTNDTVLLLASGGAGKERLSGTDLQAFQAALTEVCIELARMIADDGEGASHLINVEVTGCRTREDAHRIAKTIANSSLVKTGIAGADPNWGRIVSAAGYSGVAFDPDRVDLSLNGTLLFQQGEPVEFDAASLSRSIRDQRETFISLQFAEGTSAARFWTSDLTLDYVRFNSEYHT